VFNLTTLKNPHDVDPLNLQAKTTLLLQTRATNKERLKILNRMQISHFSGDYLMQEILLFNFFSFQK
jgi:hypothetical protein